MKTKHEIIDETAAFYNSGNRAAMSRGPHALDACFYNMPDGRKCAFGRCMENPPYDVICSITQLMINNNTEKVDDLLKPEYRGHPLQFWISLQSFHDHATFWTDTGLSPDGEKMRDTLKREWPVS